MAQITTVDEIKKLGTILGVWAHPDDETYCMAGIMAAASKNGQKVVCVTATRGEAGIQDPEKWPKSQLAQIRTAEYEKAVSILGVDSYHWLDYPDGGCTKVDVDEAVQKIAEYITVYKPDSIFTFGPDGMTGHKDHRTVADWTVQAAKFAKSIANIYRLVITDDQYSAMLPADRHLNVYFNIVKPITDDSCNCDIDFELPQDIYNLKIAALKAMPSQTEKMLQDFHHVLPKAVGKESFRLYTNE